MAEVLPRARDPRALDGLIEALTDEAAVVRSAAARALGSTRDDRVVGPLIEALEDEHEWVRAAAARSLKWFEGPRVMEALLEAMTDVHYSVRAGAGTVSVRPIERGNTLLFVALQAKRLRGYTGTEEAKMRRHSGYSAILKGRALFETQMLISSKDFILTYFAKYRGSMKLNMSLCRAMDCGRGINQLTFTGDDAVLGYVQGSGGDVTLVFDYSTRDPNPVLNIMPHPGGSLDKAIRMPVRTGGHPAEYGTLADMKKYIPGELLKK